MGKQFSFHKLGKKWINGIGGDYYMLTFDFLK